MAWIPMDSESLLARVSDTKDSRNLPALIRDLCDVDAELLFRTLFPVAIRMQGAANGPVAFSAVVLHALNPPCPLEPCVATQMLTREWDISIEEVPWYLANQFGAETIDRCAEQLIASETDEIARQRMEAVRYWVGVYRKQK